MRYSRVAYLPMPSVERYNLGNAGGMYVGPLGIVLDTIKKVLNPSNSFLTQLREIEIP